MDLHSWHIQDIPMKDNPQIKLQPFLWKTTFKSLLIQPPINAFHCYNVKVQPGTPSILLTRALQRAPVSILECHLTFCSATSGRCASIGTPGPNQGHGLWELGLPVPWRGHEPHVGSVLGMLAVVTCSTLRGKSQPGWWQTPRPQLFHHSKVRTRSLWALWAMLRRHHPQAPGKLLKPSALWVLHHVFLRSTNVGMLILGEKGLRVYVSACRERNKCISCPAHIGLPSLCSWGELTRTSTDLLLEKQLKIMPQKYNLDEHFVF